jgi:hypothetical protein
LIDSSSIPTRTNNAITIQRKTMGSEVNFCIHSASLLGTISTVKTKVIAEAKAIRAPTIAAVTALRKSRRGRSDTLSFLVIKNPTNAE